MSANSPSKIHRLKSAFTLVELLVVITIIGILISLLLPAVQSAREAARRTQCANHLKQLSLASLTFEQAHGYLPSGGWGYMWDGDPDCGVGADQPGGWIYNILPYIEQQSLFDLGKDSDRLSITTTQKATAKTRSQTPLETFNCPSRRQATLSATSGNSDGSYAYNTDSYQTGFKSDYAGNVGTVYATITGPNTMPLAATYSWNTSSFTGVIFAHSKISLARILDGSSNTFLAGEKCVTTTLAAGTTDRGDNVGPYTGHSLCNLRVYKNGVYPLVSDDTANSASYFCFGSAHASGCNFAFCDGSVHSISYSVDPATVELLANKADNQPIITSPW